MQTSVQSIHPVSCMQLSTHNYAMSVPEDSEYLLMSANTCNEQVLYIELLLLELVPTLYSQSGHTVNEFRAIGYSDSAALTFLVKSTLAP